MRQRGNSDIWQDLFEFLLVETQYNQTTQDLLRVFEKQYGFRNYELKNRWNRSQKLSHQLIEFSLLQLNITLKKEITGYKWIEKTELDGFAFPKTLQQYIKDQLVV